MDLFDRARIIAQSAGLSKSEAKKAAQVFCDEVNERLEPPTEPDYLIREVGQDFEIVLKNDNSDKARDLLNKHKETHDVTGAHKLKDEEHSLGKHKFIYEKQSPKSSSSSSTSSSTSKDEPDDIVEAFKDLDEDEVEETLKEIQEHLD